jgi:hypothetical protein
MAEEIIREYNMADDVMLERADTFHDALALELPSFTLRFPWMDPVWLTALRNDIDAADAFPTDENVVMDLKVLTGDVGSAMQQGYAALQTLGVYAKLAYPKDEARQRVFGQQYWQDARSSTLKLQEALELAHDKADHVDYTTTLVTKGYTVLEIAGLATLAGELQLKNRLQESAKLGRKVSRHDRVALHNVVWNHMQTLNTCATVVWAADAERMAQYQLYPSQSADITTQVAVIVSDPMTSPVPGVNVRLTNTALPPIVTDATGKAIFADNSLPELLDVRLEHTSMGVRDYPGQAIVLNEANELRLMF